MATRNHFNAVILVSLIPVILTSALVEESSRTSSKLKPMANSAVCLKKCSSVLADGSRRKFLQVPRVFPSCYYTCIQRGEDRERRTLKEKISKKRTRKDLPPNPDCPSSSPTQSVDWFPSEVHVRFGENEIANIWYINVSWTLMDDSLGNWTGILVRLAILPDNSWFTRTICFLHPKNQTFLSMDISSYGYKYPGHIFLKVIGFPFSQPGNESSMEEGNSNVKMFTPVLPHTTSFPASSTTTVPTKSDTKKGSSVITMVPYTETNINPPTGQNHITVKAVSISIGILIGISLVAGLLKYFVCHKKNIFLPQEFAYHAFIIYNHADTFWVTKKLLPLLEEKHHLKCCIHYRDFAPGRPFQDSMAESVYKSYKIIAVFSSNFLKSNYCSYELNIAKYRLLNRGDNSLIMIRIDEADSKNLPRELRKRNFIDYCNPLERPFWEDKVLKFLDVQNDELNDQSTTTQQIFYNNNNSNNNSIIISKSNHRTDFNRLNSTTSNDTVISVVAANEEEIF